MGDDDTMKNLLSIISTTMMGALCLTATLSSAQESGKSAADAGAAAKADAAAVSKSVKKKVTKAKNTLTEAGEEGAGAVSGISGSKQEVKPGKYSGEMTFSFGFTSGSGSAKTDGTDEATKTSSSTMSLSGSYAFIFGKFAAGPIVDYSNKSEKTTPPGGLAGTTTTTANLGFGLLAEYFISDIQTEKMVPFVAFSYLTSSGSISASRDGETSKATTSGDQMALGGGLKYFLARHISVDPTIAYVILNSTDKSGDPVVATKTTSSDIRLLASLSIYL